MTTYDKELKEHATKCKYLGMALWDCGHIENTNYCDCHLCLAAGTEQVENS